MSLLNMSSYSNLSGNTNSYYDTTQQSSKSRLNETEKNKKEKKEEKDLYKRKFFIGGIRHFLVERDIVEYFLKFGQISEC